jgi:phytoene synthase
MDGMAADLAGVRIADDDTLLRYAYQVSSAVGLLLAPLLGVRGDEAMRRVIDLGVGLQISNILVGVGSDARRGRVYLPATRLAAVGLGHEDVLRDPGDPRLLPVLGGLAELGGVYYRSAEQGAILVPLRYRHGVLLLSRVYGGLGRRAARGEPLEHPGKLPVGDKVRRLGEVALAALRPDILGVRPMEPHDARLHRAFAGWPGAHAG